MYYFYQIFSKEKKIQDLILFRRGGINFGDLIPKIKIILLFMNKS
jgi:hypothetical protein